MDFPQKEALGFEVDLMFEPGIQSKKIAEARGRSDALYKFVIFEVKTGSRKSTWKTPSQGNSRKYFESRITTDRLSIAARDQMYTMSKYRI